MSGLRVAIRVGRKGHDLMIGEPGDDAKVVRRGLLLHGRTLAEYYTSQPALTQWLAIGMVSIYSEGRRDERMTQLLVGTGRTETAAVGSLWDRLTALPSAAPPAPAGDSDPQLPDSSESQSVPCLLLLEPALRTG